MNEAKQILEMIINDFSAEKLSRFFREKSRQFITREESYARYNDDDFKNGVKLGEINFQNNDRLLICVFEVKKELSERTGKKAQYEKAKAILKTTGNRIYSASIFIFYDANGNFRFSLVYPESIGVRRRWNNFRRFTYFVSSDSQITNKTFKQRIGDGDFSSLEKIKDAFSVEKVTKEFYQDIANWYFWAVEHCQFPKNIGDDPNAQNVAIIRLITRIIFIWFMRERGLVPKDLFEEKNILKILKNITPEESTYYKAILQNLFFATLSTKKKERDFGSEKRFNKGWNKDYDNQYVFRYHELFKNPDDIQKYFNNIPFLNGGLFECLDDKRNGIIIDGFSRTKKNQPIVPNLLFFNQEKKADLNRFYGTKGKFYKVRGLFDILSSFNFTIDENTPDDQDIALDPELLGRVFENLLASFNPETSTTARKATGSYYTPREIVDYMVAESLKAYFKIHLEEIKGVDEKLEKLFSTVNEENPFGVQESKKLVELIESVKIVDPAVGSGAFPMGALNKLVFILNKVDPGNELWKQAQLKTTDAILDPSVKREAKTRIKEFFKGKNADYGRKLYLIQKCIYGVDIQQIAVEIAKLRFFISLLVDEKIDQSKDNWGIEPLPNLDFKIMQGNSLISEFLGIDFDNGHEKQNKQVQVGLSFGQEDDSLIKEFEQKKIDFQNESDKEKKKNLKEEVEDLMIKVFEIKVKKQKAGYFQQAKEIEQKYSTLPNQKKREELIAQEKQKLSKKSGFDLENIEKQLREFTSKKKTRPFFPWKLYFAEVFEKGGFDIVIANPPYVRQEEFIDIKNVLKNKYSSFFNGRADLYTYFIKLGFNLIKTNGIFAYITSNKFFVRGYGENTRLLLTKEVTLQKLINFGELPVFQASVDSTILIAKNSKPNNDAIEFAQAKVEADIKYISKFFNDNKDTIKSNALGHGEWLLQDTTKLAIFNKIKNNKDTLSNYCNKSIFAGIKTGYDNAFVINEITKRTLIEKDPSCAELIKPWLRGRDVQKWQVSYKKLYIIYIPLNKLSIDEYPVIKEHLSKFKTKLERRATNQKWYEIQQPQEKFTQLFDQSKIIYPDCAKEMRAAYDESGAYGTMAMYFIPYDSVIIGILNSTLFDWYSRMTFATFGDPWNGGRVIFKTIYMSKVPIPDINNKLGLLIKEIVDKILVITKSGDYLKNPEKQAQVKKYEKQIDQRVYKLYRLTKEEIKIVENFNKE